MIGRLTGTVTRRAEGRILLDVGGVGFELDVPLSTLATLPGEGAVTTLEVLTVFRSESLSLYGFRETLEKTVFETLLDVSGVGPKLGLAVLSTMSVSELVRAVRDESTTALVKVPGIGKKTAERLLLELRDRLDGLPVTLEDAAPVPVETPRRSAVEDDAIAALVHLGYKGGEAERAVVDANEGSAAPDLGELVREALRRLGSR